MVIMNDDLRKRIEELQERKAEIIAIERDNCY